jgi:hypothetical protein
LPERSTIIDDQAFQGFAAKADSELKSPVADNSGMKGPTGWTEA